MILNIQTTTQMRSPESKEKLDINKAIEILHILQPGLAFVISQIFSSSLRVQLDACDNSKSSRVTSRVLDMGTYIIK